ncbi:MAG: phytanoyl-CoA dioxygenase (PhyH) family protein [Puniceicoccaceae bacterium 5H]|nr:MAG: phytanoyl-CoA dioxygenase (PhyH) family protein [Puniceicoccaceae bacterium 5H]
MRDLWQTRPKLRILYIGTGPYATLLMPLLVMGGTSALERVDLVEVNPSSARMLQTCLDLLELDQRRIHLYAADFMSWETPHRYDLIICEVMAAALVREPQMAVVKKARGLLSPGGVLIPERISLFWGLSNQNREPRWPSGMSRVPPARYQWTHLGDLSAAETPPTTVELEVKRAHCEGQELTLFTEVQVYGEEVLQDAESMIVNTVCVFSDFRAYPCRLRLHYVEGPRPGWTAEPIRSGEGNCLRGK